MKADTSEHLKPRSQYAEDAVQLAIAGKWDEAAKLNRFIIENFGADEESQNRLGKALSELGKLKLENQFLRTELGTADRAKALGVFEARSPSKMIAARVIATATGAATFSLV